MTRSRHVQNASEAYLSGALHHVKAQSREADADVQLRVQPLQLQLLGAGTAKVCAYMAPSEGDGARIKINIWP